MANMTALREIYKCGICGNVVELVHEGAVALVCCGKPMNRLDEKKEDAGKEKHVPVVEDVPGGVRVKVGSVDHPMEPKHYIKFIEVLTADQVLRAELKPGMSPQAVFKVAKPDIQKVREYCTVHDLWAA